jgi:hypothetical protein
MTLKRKRGRPPLMPSGEIGRRYQLHIPPSIAEGIRRLGLGSISRGVTKLYQLYERL